MRETPSTEDFQAAHIASLEARVIELEAATRTVLAAWDDASGKLAAFIKDNNKQTAEEYATVFPRLFDTAILMRTVLNCK